MTLRALGLLFACGVAANGCARVVFDHALSSSAGADGGAARAECAGAQDGARCDDRDVCTPSSTCRAGVCVGGNAFDSCVIADSEADFSGVQGENGWYYGYWNASADADGSYSSEDFAEMEYCDDNNWRPPGRCGMSEDDPGFRWTMNLAWGLQHPETEPDLELPIRRWQSFASGIDFGARLMNSMLVTVFAAMGLSPADYERNGVAGFGDYQGRESDRYAAYVSDAERRKPLPYLYTGA